MSQISKPHGDFVALTTAEAAKVNDQFNTIYNDHNGQITDANIHSLAGINQGKVLNLISDLNVIRSGKVQEVSVVVFTANGTYTKPSDLLFARVICIGGGGGGALALSTGGGVSSGGGGGSGSYSESWLLAASINAVETVTIGPGGTANSGNGGTTTFGASFGANGGGGGFPNGDSIGAGGVGGGVGSGHIIIAGVPGSVGFITTAPFGVACGGRGGASGPYMIPGVCTPTGAAAPGSSGGLGGGGAGAASVGNATANGGAGGSGIVIVVEFRA